MSREGAGSRPVLLLLILAAGAWLRFQGLDWDQGQHLHPDERFLTMVGTAIGMPDSAAEYFDTARSPLNPANRGFGYFVYGTFPLFLTRILAEMFDIADYGRFHLLGRGLSALFDLGTVFLAGRLGLLLAGPGAGLAAAALTATCVIGIQQAHFFTVDSFAAFFATAALLAMLRVASGGRIAWHAILGLCFGLALACRINLVLLGGVYPFAILLAWRSRGAGLRSLLFGSALFGIVTLVTFRIAQPYAFEGPGILDVWLAPDFLSSMRTIQSFVTGAADYPPSVQWIGRPRVVFATSNLLVWGLGPAWGLAALAGVFWCLARRSPDAAAAGPGRIAALWAIGLVLYHSAQFAATVRYFLPVVPVLAVAAVWPLARPGRHASARRRLLAVVLLLTAGWAVAFTAIYRRPHSRVEASRWIYANVAPGSVIANEHWDDGLPLGVDGNHPGSFDRFDLPLYAEESESKLRELLDGLDRADLLVLSSNRLYGSIPRTPWRYPLGRRYYELLFSGDLGFRLERIFTSYPRIGPIEIRDDLAEEAFSVYDHPKVLIFRKTDGFSRESVEELLRAVPLDRIERVSPREAGKLYRRFRPTALTLPDESGVRHAVDSREPGSAEALLRWLIGLEALGLAAFAILFRIAAPAADRGFAFAKLLAWLVPGYLGWLFASLRIAPWGSGLVQAIAAVFLVVGAVAAWRERGAISAFVRRRRREIVAVEAVFIVVFGIFLAIRMAHPAIFWGEKPMDFAILNASLRSVTMPPHDPWFAGESLNYYYFGHALVAALALATGVPAAHAFNLAIATLGGLLAVASYALARQVAGSLAAGALAAGAVALLGNLAGLRELLSNASRSIDFHYFWATSRVIEGTINEFPFWNLVFGDLHAHVMAMPFEVALLYLGSLWLSPAAGFAAAFSLGLAVSWMLGVVAVTSSWSFPTAAGLQIAFLATAWRARRGGARALAGTVVVAAAILLTARLLFLPFWSAYRFPPGRGWGLETSAAPLVDVLTIFGVFLPGILPVLAGATRPRSVRQLGGFAAGAAAVAAAVTLRSAATGFYVALALAGLATWVRSRDTTGRVGGLLAGAAGAIGAGTEIVFVFDRMNTVFKYYLGMWLLLGGANGLLIPLWWRSMGRGARWGWAVVVASVAVAGAFTSVSGAAGFLRVPRVEGPVPTLDGMAYLDPSERAAYRWLNHAVEGIPVILEAQGPSYRQFSRVSMNTGLPTVVGWEYHLVQQARSRSAIEERNADVAELYSTTDLERAAGLLRKYRIDLVFVGALERQTYSAAGLRKFAEWRLTRPVFQDGEVTIYATPGMPTAVKTWVDAVEIATPRARPAPLDSLREPRDVAIGADGEIYVADFGNRRIVRFDALGDPVDAFGTEGPGSGELRDPCGVAVGPDGTLWVADTWNHRIQQFSPEGQWLGEWRADLYGPRGVAVAPDGTLFVTDTGHHRLLRWDPRGGARVLAGPEALQSPIGVAVGPGDEIYVADTGNRRVAVFSREGALLRSWPVAGWRSGTLLEPYLDVGPDGVVWVTDPPAGRVRLYDGLGRPLGEASADQRLELPLGIAVTGPDRALVTSATSRRLIPVQRGEDRSKTAVPPDSKTLRKGPASDSNLARPPAG